MCGRFVVDFDETVVDEVFDAVVDPTGRADGHPSLTRTWNAAPGTPQAIVRNGGDGGRELTRARWGLVPGWAKDPTVGRKMINARAESIASRPAFREAFALRRCIVPASGFYEWDSVSRSRAPYLFRVDDGAPFAMAGVWERWRDPEGAWLQSFSIVTTAPNPLLARVHDRMPLILDGSDLDAWLAPTREVDPKVMRPFAAGRMSLRRVSKRVNSPRVDDPTLVAPEIDAQGRLF